MTEQPLPAAAQDPHGVNSLADVEAMEATPLADRALPATTYDALRRAAQTWPDRTALRYFDSVDTMGAARSWTYAEFLSDITRTGNMLRGLGIGSSDVVAYLLPNLPETHLLIWGGEAAGIVMALNPALGVEEITALLTAGEARALAALGPVPGTDIWEKATAAVAEVEGLDTLICVGPQPGTDTAGGARVVDFAATIAAAPADALQFDLPEPGALSSYFCTGGTTGLPKIARRTHGTEVFDAWAIGASRPEMFDTDAVAFCGLPLFHVNAQIVTGLSVWMNGGEVVLGTAAGYRTEGVIARFWEIVETFRVSFFSGVPTIYSGLLSVPVAGHDLSSLDFGICGAAPMPVELFRKFQTETGLRILEGYGLTEGTCASSLNPAKGEPRIGSIGVRLPYQQMQSAVLDDDGAFLRWCAVDEAGSLLLEGPNVFAGYVDPAQTRAVWVDIDGVRWMNTGDMARQDADGFFWLTGRKKELIIRGGHNIDPAVIENPIHRHPEVALAAAVGRPDAHSGEVPVLYVQPKEGVTLDPETVAGFAEAEIGERAARPKAIRIVAAMPLTAVGKIFKPRLVMMEIEDVVRQEAAKAGVALADVMVEQDPSRGMVARVTLTDPAAEAPLHEVLGQYAFSVEIATA